MWLFAVFLLLAARPEAGFAQGAVSGTVSASRGGSVAAAVVTLTPAGDSTAARRMQPGTHGQFRFAPVADGRWRLRVEQLGFLAADTVVTVRGAPVVLAIVLAEQAISLSGVYVEAERTRARFDETAGVTATGLNADDLKLLPGLAEADVLRAIEVLPGVVTTSDYSSSYNVRGGSSDQNLILLDGVPVYNPFHLGGLFSVFNADMIGRAELLAGGFPAQHGGRVSSVLQIESDAGAGGFDGAAGISLLATRVALGTSLPAAQARALGVRDARARVSVRRSYFDQVLRPLFDFPYHLTDVQAFAEAWTPAGARAQLTAYTGRDVLDFTGADDFPLKIRWTWGNDVAGAGWTQPFGGGQSLDTRVGFSRFQTAIRFPEFQDTEFRSEIRQLLLRADWERPLAGESQLRLGYELDRLEYDNLAATGGTVFRQGADRAWLNAAYAQGTWRLRDWLLEAGARADLYHAASDDARLLASPRAAIKRFLGSGDVALKLAAGRYSQFVHSLRDEELPLGIDIWVISGARAPVVISDQVQGGVEAFAGDWQFVLEGYHRSFDGVTTQNNADDPNTDADDLLAGTGRSYGADLLVRREAGRVRPMLAVSWLRARRTFEDVLSGEEPTPRVSYAPVFDRRVDIDLTVTADAGRDVQLGFRLNFGTGLPYTRPLGAYIYHSYQPLDGSRTLDTGGDSASVAVRLGDRNGARYPAYLRVDVGARKRFVRPWGTLTPYLDVLNLTNRRNVLFYFYEYDRSPARRSGVSMFPLLPSVGMEVTF